MIPLSVECIFVFIGGLLAMFSYKYLEGYAERNGEISPEAVTILSRNTTFLCALRYWVLYVMALRALLMCV